MTNKARGPARLEVKCSLRWTSFSSSTLFHSSPRDPAGPQGILRLFKCVKQGPEGSGSLQALRAHTVLTAGASPLFTSCFLMAIARRAASEAGQFPPLRPQTTGEGAAECCSGRDRGSACPADPSLTPSKGCFGKGDRTDAGPGAGTPASAVKQRPQTSLFLRFFQSGKRSKAQA